MKEPIMKFKNEKQLREYGKIWQNILYLDDWIIEYRLVDKLDSDTDNFELHGLNTKTITHKEALIQISKYRTDDYFSIKVCDEQTLIHELLHCNFEVTKGNPGIEDLFYETMQHQKLEFMSRSLLRAKYNLSKEWFKNWSDE